VIAHGSVLGPRDNFDLETSRVIPAMIRKCIDARDRGVDSITLWGDGSPTASSCTWPIAPRRFASRASITTTQHP